MVLETSCLEAAGSPSSATLLGKLRTEGDALESQCSSVFQEVPASLDPIPAAFSPPSPAPYAACALSGVQAVQVPPAAEPSLIILREAKSHFSVGHQPSILAAGSYLTLNFVLTMESFKHTQHLKE